MVYYHNSPEGLRHAPSSEDSGHDVPKEDSMSPNEALIQELELGERERQEEVEESGGRTGGT